MELEMVSHEYFAASGKSPCEWNFDAWLIICSLDGLEGVLVVIVICSFFSPKANGTGNVFTSVIFFFISPSWLELSIFSYLFSLFVSSDFTTKQKRILEMGWCPEVA